MWLLACILCLTRHLVHVYSENLYGIVGENFTFPVQIDRKMVEPVWKKDRHKVAEWEGQNEPTYFSPLDNRSVLMENGSLTIFNLERDDAGQYELQYRYSGEDRYLNFVLSVLGPLPEPKISCNTSNNELVLNCTADFQESLTYIWKLSNDPHTYLNQVLSIPWKRVDTVDKATCIIKFSQTEKSSEISLSQCRPEEKGESSSVRNRDILIGVFTVAIIAIIIVFLYKKGIIRLRRGMTAQKNSPVNGSGEHEQLVPVNSQQQPNSGGGEHEQLVPGNSQQQPNSGGGEHEQLVPGNSQQQPNSEGATFSHAVHGEDEEPEADRALNEDDSALKDKQIVKNGVNQKEVTQDAEGGSGEHLNNSSSCSTEDLREKNSNCFVAQTNVKEKQ